MERIETTFGIRSGKSFFGGLVVSLGLSLAACQGSESGVALALEDEGDPSRSFVKKIVGGVIAKVRTIPGSHTVALVIRETRVTAGGRPLCLRPTGRILSIGRVGQIFSASRRTLQSAMVVMGASVRTRIGGLRPGDCVSVVPEDGGGKRDSVALGSRIEILDTPSVVGKDDRMGEGMVELWGEPGRGGTEGASRDPGFLSAHARAVPASPEETGGRL
ncbi:MAG: hypothetical protein ACYDBP_09215 [Leptospirales bacterium]